MKKRMTHVKQIIYQKEVGLTIFNSDGRLRNSSFLLDAWLFFCVLAYQKKKKNNIVSGYEFLDPENSQ